MRLWKDLTRIFEGQNTEKTDCGLKTAFLCNSTQILGSYLQNTTQLPSGCFATHHYRSPSCLICTYGL